MAFEFDEIIRLLEKNYYAHIVLKGSYLKGFTDAVYISKFNDAFVATFTIDGIMRKSYYFKSLDELNDFLAERNIAKLEKNHETIKENLEVDKEGRYAEIL